VEICQKFSTKCGWSFLSSGDFPSLHQGREIIAIGALENGAFCTVFSENFHKL
jgi:hypothetical protein